MKNSDVIYAFRRRGFDGFCTCSKDRYNELSEKPSTFEVAIFYTKAPAVAVNEQMYQALKAAKLEIWRLLDSKSIDPKGISKWPEMVLVDDAIAAAEAEKAKRGV